MNGLRSYPRFYPPSTALLPSTEAGMDDCMDRVSIMMHLDLTYRDMCQSQKDLFGVVYDFEVGED